MFKKFAFLTMVLGLLVTMFGLTAPAASAEDFHFTVVATDYSHGEASFSLENEQIIKVNGSDQVSWEVENSTATISAKRVKAAPRIRTSCTNANRTTQSQQIWRKTHHASVVVVLPGSCLWNRGKHDNIMMGFKWDVKTPAVLVGDRNHRYRHGFSLVRSRSQVAPDEKVVGKVTMLGRTWLIVRKCRNFIGGPVDVYVPSAVQLHYASDIKKHAKAVAKSRVEGTVTFNITCPNGANFNTTVSTWAYGYGYAEINYTERTRDSVIYAHKAQMRIDSSANGEVEATSSAGSKIDVSGSCGENPPAYETPSVDVTPVACVNPGTTRDVTITVSNPNAIDDTAKVTYRGQVYTKAVAAHGQVTFTFPNQGAGTYSGTALLVTADKSKSFTVTVEECPVSPPAITEITTVNDVVEYNARTINVIGTGTPGETVVLFATAKHGGSITAGTNQNVTVDASGNWSATVEYTAGESPKDPLTYMVDGNTYTIAAGKDVVWFHATNTAGQGMWAKSNDFAITPRPITP